MTQYLTYKTRTFMAILVVAVLITICSVILLWVDYLDEFNRNSICKSLFNIFPESFFLKPEIKEYLGKTNLTQRLLRF